MANPTCPWSEACCAPSSLKKKKKKKIWPEKSVSEKARMEITETRLKGGVVLIAWTGTWSNNLQKSGHRAGKLSPLADKNNMHPCMLRIGLSSAWDGRQEWWSFSTNRSLLRLRRVIMIVIILSNSKCRIGWLSGLWKRALWSRKANTWSPHMLLTITTEASTAQWPFPSPPGEINILEMS